MLPQFHVSTASPYHIERWFRRASELPAEAAYASSVKKFEAAAKARVVGSYGGESLAVMEKACVWWDQE
jgi:hypothetical protein